MVNRSQPRLDAMAELAQKVGSTIPFEFICNEDGERNDGMMAGPGSPITDAGVFPLRGVAWEYNYRGDLVFLRQAQAQKESRNLTVEDGWVYFLHGWTQVIAQVFHTEI
ncbi:MAG: shikimate dehydrogenase, partial [Anaerolineae bacterium]|nr:shikimate dehydrogenase [Anaerolineae bacterium]